MTFMKTNAKRRLLVLIATGAAAVVALFGAERSVR
jgi:hypothetical protein